jgi:hypothetical protein
MSRNHRHGTIQATVAEAYRAAGGIENAAADIGLSISTLSEATDVPRNSKRAGGLGINHLHILAIANPASAAVLAQHFARLAGGVFQPVQAGGTVVSLYDGCGTVSKECGEAVAATLSAATKATAGNISAAIKEIDEAQSSLSDVKSHLEARLAAFDLRVSA